jgi:hypothetical protein
LVKAFVGEKNVLTEDEHSAIWNDYRFKRILQNNKEVFLSLLINKLDNLKKPQNSHVKRHRSANTQSSSANSQSSSASRDTKQHKQSLPRSSPSAQSPAAPLQADSMGRKLIPDSAHDLKTLCTAAGLPVSGTVAKLKERLRKYYAEKGNMK